MFLFMPEAAVDGRAICIATIERVQPFIADSASLQAMLPKLA